MNYLSVTGLSKNIGERWLFENLGFGLQKGQKVALIGKNGTGKTSLMECLSGRQAADAGTIALREGLRMGYLPQNPDFSGFLEAKSYLFSDDLPQAKALMDYDAALQSGDTQALQKAMESMDQLQAWDYESKAQIILDKLGIKNLEQSIATMSGGQKRRLALAKLLVESPEVMLLDEPTNHLDLDSILWLEEWLSGPNQTLIMVSHDRYFLDRVCGQLWELEAGQLSIYQGNYAYFLEKKAEKEAIEASMVAKAKNTYKKELEWMRRQPKARGTKAQYRIDSFYDTERMAKKDLSKSSMELQVQMARLGNKILEIQGVHKSYGAKAMVKDFSYIFKKKDRIGIIGPNGVGKTTLLQMLTGSLAPDQGQIDPGQTLVIGYYQQIPAQFEPGKRVIDAITDMAEVISYGKNERLTPAQFLNKFLFPPAKQYTPIEKLSGGEKKRLQLMQVLVHNPNFLILDEPTNDLDLESLQILEDFLLHFEGCLLLVSHDRYFMDCLVDQLLVPQGDGHWRFFNGNYTDYRNAVEEENQNVKNPKPSAPSMKPREEAKIGKKLSFKEQQELNALETEMPKISQEILSLETSLSSGESDAQRIMAWAKELEEKKAQLEVMELRWLELSE